MGLNNLLTKIFGNKSDKDLKELKPYVAKINEEFEKVKSRSNDDLRARSAAMRREIRDFVQAENDRIAELKASVEGKELSERESIWAEVDKIEEQILDKKEEKLAELLPEAFAIMKDTARRFFENETIEVTATDFDRDLSVTKDFVTIEGDKAIYKHTWMAGGNPVTWDMIHYDVQLIGGVVLHQGKIAEMATGEGKTLVATLPVFLNALTGSGVHVVTVNDYLARRDSEWMGPLYMFHGLSVACIDKTEPNSPERRAAYECDITFGTNNEFGFDYLRDNMARKPADLVQRKHNYAIVDEVDSVLIDDARTPLIISGPVETKGDQMFEEFRSNVELVVNAQKTLATRLLTEAKQKIASDDKATQEDGYVQLFRSYKGLPKNKALIKYLSEEGIKKHLLETEAYFMADNNREMHTATDVLYFVIDEKTNRIELTDKGIDLLTGKSDDPEFFILPDIATMMSDLENQDLTPEEKTAKKDELLTAYAIKSERVHTINQLLRAYTLFEKDDQYVVMDNKVLIVDEQTGRIMDGRRYSDGLHQAIEAKEHVKVEQASQTKATITLQNYFRMYHKLAGMTGTAETEAKEFWDIYKLDVVVIPTNKPVKRIDENDRIYKTTRVKYAAVIDEIQSLIAKGRPVLVGTTSVEISELLSKMLTLRKIPHQVLNAKLHQKEAEIVALAGQKGTVTIATNMAGRGTDIKLAPEVRDAGGLAIIGTERHESRRVDRQLRGRAGRQGDPGSSLFFVSLEDNLMRLFGSERMARIMDQMGLKEGEVIQHSMITKAVERAQKKVEENNFGMRKRLLEYDDVMNNQRTVIYNKRRNALYGDRLSIDISNIFYDTCELLYDDADSSHDYETFKMEMIRVFALEVPYSEKEFFAARRSDMVQQLYELTYSAYKDRMQRLGDLAYPFIKDLYERTQYLNVVFPITDGKKTLNVVTPLKKSYENKGREVQLSIEKSITLAIIDDLWKEHLRELDDLKTSVQNAAYEQKDPLLIYKFESFNLFEKMLLQINREIATFLSRAQLPVREEGDMREARQPRRDDRQLRTSRTDAMDAASRQRTSEPVKTQPVHVEKKVGRNDPCPCGSGKKYKNCHGRDAE